ncbi:DNA-binding transcriptional response regulator [Roseimaritima multifibrata]|uniref:DNA-binding transcriptional response regulator n=1 Tax=Roseimaritima multifibrata TaxID=1930274 RepID=A0A517MHE5_9BACT|nr:sigma-54 dependent transcriptional regulator [Roseimaritima multifibrata]QDS94303.1 DNA-binding transcriptional response regulator [Roseimaritima multifibrata]
MADSTLPSAKTDSSLGDELTEASRAEYSLLIIDNDPAHARAMTESLERVGYRCTVATSGPEGARLIERETFHVVITDMVMNDIDGMKILALARKRLPDCEVLLVTGHASVPIAVEAMQEGAFTFMEKPITPQRLRAVTEKAVQAVRLRQQNTELRQRLDERFGFEGIIYASPEMQQVIDRLKRIAPTDATVLITGESGTGKEMIAQAIHQNSPRRNKRIVELNTRAVSEHLVESELFGHVKGAYTDAVSDRVGAFEYANGGSLFLDEVGDMPMSTQIKLLRVLEEHEITRVGDNKPIKVNVRLISATNRPLEEMVEDGSFRNDLYFRIKVVTVTLPPLRDRRDDIIPLMDHFRKSFLKRHAKPTAHFTPDVTKRFFAYQWPGNIRQLRNFVETMVVLDNDGSLGEDDLPPELSEQVPEDAPSPNMVSGPVNLIGKPLATIERWAIEETLRLSGGNREEAARTLGIGPRTLYRRLDEYKKLEQGDDAEGSEE